MKHYELKGTLRTEFGKKAAKAIKRSQNIPCVVYGLEGTTHFTVASADVRNLIFTPSVMFVDLCIENSKKIALLKEIQFDPVSDAVIHIDFYEVDAQKPVKLRVPLRIVGNSPGVKAGGKLQKGAKKLFIKGMMENIPDVYEVSIDELKLGETIRVKNLVSDTLEFIDAPATIIASCLLSRGAAEGESTEGAEENAAE